MNRAKNILQKLADGKEAAGLNGAALSKELRDALIQGAKALEFKQRVVSALNQTAVSSQSAPAPAPAAQAAAPAARPAEGAGNGSMPRRWSQEEDNALVVEFVERKLTLEAIAGMHRRSNYAIAVRLMSRHKLLTKDEVEAVRQRQVAGSQGGQANAAPHEQSSAPAAPEPTPPAPAPAPAAAADAEIPWDASDSSDFMEADAANPFVEEPATPAPASAPAPAPVAAAPVDDSPDYGTLFEMEMETVPNPEAREHAQSLLDRLKAQPHIAPSIIVYLDGEKAKTKLPPTLRLALQAKIRAQQHAA